MIADTSLSITIKPVKCYSCGIWFGLDSIFKDDRLNDQRNWFCPNGHAQHFIGETEAQREKRRADDLQSTLDVVIRDRDWHQKNARIACISNEAKRTMIRKLKERVAAGVCPCCHRTFQSLAKHMHTKHPQYAGFKAKHPKYITARKR